MVVAICAYRRRNERRHQFGDRPIPKNNDVALAAFVARKAEIEAALDRIRAACADHVCASPEDVNWGHVGTLVHDRARLREITDVALYGGVRAD
jgi:hypothetical protein